MKIEMNKVSKLIIVLSLLSLTLLSACTSVHIAIKVVKLNKKSVILLQNKFIRL
jgi:hypothetical protein